MLNQIFAIVEYVTEVKTERKLLLGLVGFLFGLLNLLPVNR